jgi:hypothetical protein
MTKNSARQQNSAEFLIVQRTYAVRAPAGSTAEMSNSG